MKKFLLFAIALTVVAAGGFAQAKVKIGVSIAVFDDVWLTFLRDSMTAWAEGKNIDLTIVDAKNDTAKQVGQIETFVAQGMQAIVVLPVDTAATGPMTKLAVSKKIPLVYVNRQPSNLPKGNVVYVGSFSLDSGVMSMQELGKAMNGKGNLVILMGALDNEAAIARTDGVKKVIKSTFPAIKVIREQTGNWRREEGRTIMENWLASGDQIDGVAANNDEMALGALLALKAAGKLGKIPVGGVDGSPDALASMEKGELNNTVFQDPAGQGQGALEAAFLMATKKANPKVKDGIIWIPYQPITKANYKSFMK